jgi:hypothetical protein
VHAVGERDLLGGQVLAKQDERGLHRVDHIAEGREPDDPQLDIVAGGELLVAEREQHVLLPDRALEPGAGVVRVLRPELEPAVASILCPTACRDEVAGLVDHPGQVERGPGDRLLGRAGVDRPSPLAGAVGSREQLPDDRHHLVGGVQGDGDLRVEHLDAVDALHQPDRLEAGAAHRPHLHPIHICAREIPEVASAAEEPPYGDFLVRRRVGERGTRLPADDPVGKLGRLVLFDDQLRNLVGQPFPTPRHRLPFGGRLGGAARRLDPAVIEGMVVVWNHDRPPQFGRSGEDSRPVRRPW